MFWLDKKNPLKIYPQEYLEFLKQIYLTVLHKKNLLERDSVILPPSPPPPQNKRAETRFQGLRGATSKSDRAREEKRPWERGCHTPVW